MVPLQKPIRGLLPQWNINNAGIPPPVGAWMMPEGIGNKVFDYSGNGHNGAITGALWQPGKFGSALNFDGDDDNIYMGDTWNATVNLPGWSVSAWILAKTGPATSKWDIVFAFSEVPHESDSEHVALAIINASGTLKFKIFSQGETPGDGGNFSLNTWYHVVLLWNGTTLELYVNGVWNDDVAPGGFDWKLSDRFYVAHRIRGAGDRFFWDGFVDNVVIYPQALSPAQIQHLYAHPFYPWEPQIPIWAFGVEAEEGYQEAIEGSMPGSTGVLTRKVFANRPLVGSV